MYCALVRVEAAYPFGWRQNYSDQLHTNLRTIGCSQVAREVRRKVSCQVRVQS